jgi:hypothetical protein
MIMRGFYMKGLIDPAKIYGFQLVSFPCQFHFPASFMSQPLARLRHHSKWRTLEEVGDAVALGLEFFLTSVGCC